jgi:hypothetical protein
VKMCPLLPPAECDGGPDSCFGWGLFNGNQIQRCDTCRQLPDDDAAITHVRACSYCRAYLDESAAAEGTTSALVLARAGRPAGSDECETCGGTGAAICGQPFPNDEEGPFTVRRCEPCSVFETDADASVWVHALINFAATRGL